MSRREVTQFYDDLDHTPLSENELEVIRFSVDGTTYVLDLSPANAAKFRAALEPFVSAARIVPEPNARRVNPSVIRDWARNQGIPVAHRGKIPHEIIEAYNEANA
ncbi:histone-like nucleoid-structuring protein Lsr2 [Corynebacterium phoceense]|uniref:histone-like nucleoid-structuring protein Lsr2 n=1 Tax=Corynebacterium phoceense TaxID=1686286 RepID=UPI001DB4C3A7|nr:Lsr2 family protein [Corynebacterium phoceense]MCQ9336740.1 Lsr2 family protein [Corynebacterium phoceense]HJG43221.1 Lsr2 family protein [Corynebacterium phoceense]